MLGRHLMGINILEEVIYGIRISIKAPPKNDICYGASISKDLVPTAHILFQRHLSRSGVFFRCDVAYETPIHALWSRCVNQDV